MNRRTAIDAVIVALAASAGTLGAGPWRTRSSAVRVRMVDDQGRPATAAYVDSYPDGILWCRLIREDGEALRLVSMESAEVVKRSFRTGVEVEVILFKPDAQGHPYLDPATGDTAFELLRIQVVR